MIITNENENCIWSENSKNVKISIYPNACDIIICLGVGVGMKYG